MNGRTFRTTALAAALPVLAALSACAAEAKVWEDAAEAFLKTAETEDVCRVSVVPPWQDVHRWHVIGGKVVLVIRYDPNASALGVRQKAGLAALRAGIDAVEAKDLPPAWAEQLDFAERDRAAAKKLLALADRAIASKDTLLALEGRRAKTLVYVTFDPETEDPDLIRLELLAYARRLEVRLGLKPSEPDLPTAAKESDAIRVSVDLAKFKTQNIAYDNQYKRFSERMGFTGNPGSLVVHMSGNAGRKMKPTTQSWIGGPTDFPKDGVYRFTIWIPTPAGTTKNFLVYRWEVDMSNGAIREKPTRPRSAEYPDLHGRKGLYHYTCDEKGNWNAYMLELGFGGLYGTVMPSCRVSRPDSWYFEMVPPKGEPERVKLVFPPGKKGAAESMFGCLPFHTIEQGYHAAMATAESRYGAWYQERFLKFPTTEVETFAFGDPESDKLFCEVVLKTIRDRNRKIMELIHVKPIRNYTPEVLTSGPVIRKQAAARITEIRDMKYTIEQARKQYLLDRFAGKKPVYVPPKEDAKPKKDKPKGPAMEEEEGENMDLDEEAI